MIEKILNRTSCRDYTDQKLSSEQIEKIKDVINSVPTSINQQGFSAIFVTDKKTKEVLSEINWGQKHLVSCPLLVVFVADLNRPLICIEKTGKTLDNLEKMEAYTSAVVDATIAATYCEMAALDMGLATCFIGGIRNDLEKASTLLNVEGRAIPILSMAIGYENNKEKVKPKINKCYDNKYNFIIIKKEMDLYNETIKSYYMERMCKAIPYYNATASSYAKFDYINQLETTIKRMGIDFKK